MRPDSATPRSKVVPVTGLATVRWTRRHVLIAAFVVTYICLQLAIPVAMLAVRGGWVFAPSARQTGELPFSWQMYTVVLAPPTIDVIWPDGRHERDPAALLLGELGGRAAYGDDALKGLCTMHPGAVRVIFSSAGTQRSMEC